MSAREQVVQSNARGVRDVIVPDWGEPVQRVDSAYIYEFGAKMRAATSLREGVTALYVYTACTVAAETIDEFVNKSIFAMRNSRQPSYELTVKLRALANVMREKGDWDEKVTFYELYEIVDACKSFEAIVGAELQTLSLYFASPKGAFDTDRLITSGETAFPDDLPKKVPVSIEDIRSGCRCIAFDLPTAAGFHLHRAHEAVLREYFTIVSNGAKHPRTKNMGDYLKLLNDNDWGQKAARDAIQSVKDLHRNPLIHDPSFVLTSVDQAIDLLCTVRASIGHMLREIPAPDDGSTLNLFDGVDF